MNKFMRFASVFVAFALILGASVNVPKAAFAAEGDEPTPVVSENTLATCTNGIDDDSNLLTDFSDPGCSSFVPPVAAASTPDAENTLAKCTDGIDNDQDLLTDFSDGDCSSYADPVSPVIPAENTLAKCTNGEDDDMDLLTDFSDPDCTSFATPVTENPAASGSENTLAFCTDGIDNDQDLLTDFSDGDCSPFVTVITAPTSTPTSTPADTSTSGSGGSGTGSVSGGGGITSFSSTGGSGLSGLGQSVLGASTGPESTTGATCSPVLLEYLRMGKKNSPTEVKKLQVILNARLGTKLPINGVFGLATDAAVRQWQQLYAAEVLAPWVNAGLMLAPVPTGYVYKTTIRSINNFMCGGPVFPMPMLP